jgi:hypothetical protein
LSPAMNFGLWHISCNKTVHRKCLFGLPSSGTNVTTLPTELLLPTSWSFNLRIEAAFSLKTVDLNV